MVDYEFEMKLMLGVWSSKLLEKKFFYSLKEWFGNGDLNKYKSIFIEDNIFNEIIGCFINVM